MIYPWQTGVWARLTSMVQQQRVPQALLLTGTQGLGQIELARSFGELLLCQQPAQGQPCGTCRGCQWVQAKTHPDWREVTCLDKAKTIKIQQIRELTAYLQKTPFGHRQVVFIHPADALNAAAANALLKTLEEPAGHVTIILVSSFPKRLPQTVRSRCQQLHCAIEETHSAQAWLQQQVPDCDAGLLLRAALGAPLTALALARSDYTDLRNELVQHLAGVRDRRVNPIEPVANWIKRDVQLMVQILICIGVDLTKSLMSTAQSDLIYPDCAGLYQSMQRGLSPKAVLDWYARVLSAQALLSSGTHLNVQLVLESILLNWFEIKP